MAIDLDHLLANPIFDPHRISLGFHPMHTFPAFLGYCVLVYFPKTRWAGIGLLFHLFTDGIDAIFTLYLRSI